MTTVSEGDRELPTTKMNEADRREFVELINECGCAAAERALAKYARIGVSEHTDSKAAAVALMTWIEGYAERAAEAATQRERERATPDAIEIERVLAYLREDEAEIRKSRNNRVWADTMARATDLIRNLAASISKSQSNGRS